MKAARCYSIIADEVTDVANKKKLPLVICYMQNGEIREVFVELLKSDR
ncbi:MAG: hypothetical protein MJE68_27990 [Proteobacteria bacterium]|nr:hypothetical protein [Pseudomonadota bacterium]